MNRFDTPRGTIAVLGAAAILVAVALLFMGGQASKILSTVGSSVGPNQDVAAQPEAPPATAASGAGSPGEPQVADANALAPAPGLLIVRTGTLRLQVGAVAAALERAGSIVTATGGYVAASKETGSGSDAGGSIDLRIPAPAWDRTLGSLRDLGTVLGQDIGTEEVTGQVVDLDARVANLRATEAALQAIMAKATKIDDILDVQEQLTDTRGEIEGLVAKAASLRDRAAFGSLTIALSLPVAPKPTVAPSKAPGWDPGRDVELATGKLVQVGQAATTSGIWLAIVGIPLLLAAGVGVLLLRVLWLLARRAGLVGAREPVV